jgi:hypothetical protein
MTKNAPSNVLESRPRAAESLKVLVDYAIAEGSELRLPVFVLLLRMASLELARSRSPERHLKSSSPAMHEADERVAL